MKAANQKQRYKARAEISKFQECSLCQ